MVYRINTNQVQRRDADIELDATGGDIILEDDDVEFGRFTDSSTDFVIQSSANNKDLIFKGYKDTVLTEIVRFDNSAGRVGIGTASPAKTLEVKAAVSGDGINLIAHDNAVAYIQLEAGSAGGYMQIHDSANEQRIRLDSTSASWIDGGNLGVGTDTPVTALTVEGTLTLKEQADADDDTAAYGQIWVNTATPNELYFTTDTGADVQITSGTALGGSFGAIDNGTNNITTGGILALDVDVGTTPAAGQAVVGQAGSIAVGAGGDGGMGVHSDNLYIENVTEDKDIIFRASADAGEFTTLMTMDGSESAVIMNETFTAGKIFSKTITSVTADNATHTEITATTPIILVDCSGASVTGSPTDSFHDLGLVNGTVAGQMVTVSIGAGGINSNLSGVRIAAGATKAQAMCLVAGAIDDTNTWTITDYDGDDIVFTFNSATAASSVDLAAGTAIINQGTLSTQAVSELIVLYVNALFDAGQTAVTGTLLGGGAFRLKSSVGGTASNSASTAGFSGNAMSSAEIQNGDGADPAFTGGAASPSALDTSYHEHGFILNDPTRAGTGNQILGQIGSNTATFLWDGTKWSHISGGSVSATAT